MSHLVKLLPTKLEDQGPYPVIGNFDCAITFWSLFKRWKGGLDGPLTNSIRIYLLVTLRFYSINSAQVQLNSSYFVFLYQTNTHEHYFSRHSQTLCLSLTPKRAFSHSNEKLWLLERQKKRKNEREEEERRVGTCNVKCIWMNVCKRERKKKVFLLWREEGEREREREKERKRERES